MVLGKRDGVRDELGLTTDIVMRYVEENLIAL